MPTGGGVNGVALSIAAGGAILVWSGLKNQSVPDALRGVLTKAPPTDAPTGPPSSSLITVPSNLTATASGTVMGDQVAADAVKYLGVPYRFGGATPDGWDCSGFVTWVLHHDFGIALPNNGHTVTAQFYVWGGARTIPDSARAAGDLICYPGHIGIALGKTTMINAPTAGQKTQEGNIYSGSITRRPLAYGS
jgi:cell wall-associated NlpC family hydrolase